nr:MAG TPA: Short C-terminal domain [Caudoviricetes sp.]
MRILVESLKRMYVSGKITKEKVENMKVLTDAEKQYILNT